jgi:catechol 2,3-dioxygenase-like lactoylglutathione lyase family enzyme
MSAAVHISLNVSDLDRSVEFYRRFLGEPTKRKPDYAKFVAADPEIHLALQPGRLNASAGALSHLGIRVDSTARVHEWKEALQRRGLATGEERREACCYAVQDKFWVTDPDGNRWEVYTVLEDIERKADGGMTCCQPKTEAATPNGEKETHGVAACC